MGSEDGRMFIVSKEDWSLHRKGYQDQSRHQRKCGKRLSKTCLISFLKKA